MLSSCEMTNCLHHRRKWLSFVFIMFISNRFPSSSYAHNPQKRSVGPSDVNSTEIYLVKGFPVFSFLNLTTISVLFFFCCFFVIVLLPYYQPQCGGAVQGNKARRPKERCSDASPTSLALFFSQYFYEKILKYVTHQLFYVPSRHLVSQSTSQKYFIF